MVRANNGAQTSRQTLDFFDLVTEVIDLRSFSNLWFWIVLAILWSALSQRVMGVPYYVVVRARRGHPESIEDMTAITRITVRRLLALADASGAVMIGFASFILTGLAVTGFVYGVEFLQAVFLLATPMFIAGGLSIWTARRLQATDFEDIPTQLRLHRTIIQVLGVIFIFITAFWGMFVNVSIGPLG